MNKIMSLMLCLLFLSSCAYLDRQVLYKVSCENCVTPYGRGEKVEILIQKSTKTNPK